MPRDFVDYTRSIPIQNIQKLPEWDKDKVLADIKSFHIDYAFQHEFGEMITQSFFFVVYPLHFGGHRFFFRCYCGNSVESLYRPENAREWLCRHCYKLPYQSTFLARSSYWKIISSVEMRMRRIHKIKERFKEGSKKRYDLEKEYEALEELRFRLGLKHVLDSVKQ
jgi:hypothetical protein